MYSVEVTNSGGYKFNARSKGYEFIIDATGAGIAPPDALLASLGSCTGVYIRKYLEGARLEVESFSIKVEAEFSREPLCFKEIKVIIDLKGLSLDTHRRQALLEFIKNCPVHNTLKALPKVEISLV